MPGASPLFDGRQVPAGGAEAQMLMLARELARRGYPVGVKVFEHGHQLPARFAGVDVIAQPIPRVRMPLVRTLVFYAQTASTLLRTSARAFAQQNAGSYTGLVALAARVGRRRFVYSSASVIDFDFGRLERRRRIVWLFHVGVRLADEVVVQTPEQVRLCRERFGREPVLIKSIAEPAERRAARPEAFLWIGSLASYKQPLACVQLARAVPEARFWMIAVDSPRPEAASLAAELERASRELPNLELLAPRPRAELAPMIERAVAMVNTSHYEGMPNVFLEGWSRGVPALALAHDPDGVIEREGLGAYAGGSPARMAELARAMWQRRDDQHELAARCQRYVAREHSLEHIADRWAQTLRLET
jgi:glycosyltransferase involved in cell wall biosynthesis